MISIIYFLWIMWAYGFSASFFLKNSNNFLERNLMRLGIGLGVFSILATIVNLFHLPITWWMFLLLSLPGPVIGLIKNGIKIPKIKWKNKSNLYIYIILVLFACTFFMHHKGAFSYPYLEDTDPWSYSNSIKYIATEHTAHPPEINWEDYLKSRLSRIDHYPPAYSITLSLPYQISNEMIWTMKFFNLLIVSLGVIFFYFFVKHFTRNQTIALLSTAVFSMIPSYLSHFIWAHALVVTCFFPAMYCIERIRFDKRWAIPATLILGSIAVIQPIQAIKIYLLIGIYCFIKFMFDKRLWKIYLPMVIIGGLLSFTLWLPMFMDKGGASGLISETAKVEKGTNLLGGLSYLMDPTIGTATRAYTSGDFIYAKHQNMINNPIGWGLVITLLMGFGFLLSSKKEKGIPLFSWRKEPYFIITIFWFILMFLLTNSMTFNLPIGLFAFRCWMLLAIPVCIFVGWTIYQIKTNIKIVTYVIWGLLLIGILFTSGLQKYSVNTAIWPTMMSQTSMEEVAGYSNIKEIIPKGSRIYSFSGFNHILIAFDMDVCEWCEEEMQFGVDILEYSAEDIYKWLKEHDYEYLVISGNSINGHEWRYGEDTRKMIQEKLYEIQEIKTFQPVFQNEGMVILKVI